MQIYKITNLVNGKIYIGKNSTSEENYMGSGIILKYGFEKYGKDNFKKEILEDNIESIPLLNEKEIYWIDKFKSQDPKIGYNRTPGGDGNVGKWNGDNLSSEHKEKISKSLLGREIKWKDKLSLARKNSQKVKEIYQSEEWKNKISEKMKGIERSESHRLNLRESMKNSEKLKESRSSEEFKEKCSKWQKGSKRSNEYMEKWIATKKINSEMKREERIKNIQNSLYRLNWDYTLVAEDLNITTESLKRKIKKYGIIKK